MEPINQKSCCQWILQVHKNILLFLETFHHPFECSFFFPLLPLTKHCDNFLPHTFSWKHWSLAPIVYVCVWGGRILGMYVCIFLFLTRCLFLSPVLFSVFNLWPEEKQSTQTIKKLFWKGCLKCHRTQGLMSNLSKPGINAAAKTFGTAGALKKAVAPGCYPSGSLGVDMSPGNSSEVPHYVSCALQVRVGDRDPLSCSGTEVSGNEFWSLSACLWTGMLI